MLGLPCGTRALHCCTQAFSSCVKQANYSLVAVCSFSLQLFLLLWIMGFGSYDLQAPEHGPRVVAHRLSCPLACGILVPRSGIKPVLPALACRLLTTGPPEKSLSIFLNSLVLYPLVAHLVKNLPAIQETLVGFLGWKDPLKKGYAIHSSIHGLPRWFKW